MCAGNGGFLEWRGGTLSYVSCSSSLSSSLILALRSRNKFPETSWAKKGKEEQKNNQTQPKMKMNLGIVRNALTSLSKQDEIALGFAFKHEMSNVV